MEPWSENVILKHGFVNEFFKFVAAGVGETDLKLTEDTQTYNRVHDSKWLTSST